MLHTPIELTHIFRWIKVNRVNNLISVHKKCYMAINTPGMDISDYEKQVQKKILSYREKLVVSHTRNN